MSRRVLVVLATLAAALCLLVAVERGDAATAYEAEEKEFLRLINGYRQDNGLGPLLFSDALTVASERHSRDMARYDFFAHNTEQSSYYPDGSKPWDRMEAEGYNYNTARGENLAVGYETAEQALRAWQESPSHNAAMLEKDYKVVGVSRLNVPGSTHTWYWTTDFGGKVDRSSHAAGESRKTANPANPGPSSSGQPADDAAPPGPAADTGALENGALGAAGAWRQRASDGVDLVMDNGNARLGGYHDGKDNLRQKVRVGPETTLSYDVKVRSGTGDPTDLLRVRITDGKNRRLVVLDRYAGDDRAGWRRERADLSRFAGRTVFLSFRAKTDAARLTTFYVDNVSVSR